jgi:hypothetical protein
MQFGFRSNQIDLDLFSFYFGAGWGGLEPPNIHLLAHPFRALSAALAAAAEVRGHRLVAVRAPPALAVPVRAPNPNIGGGAVYTTHVVLQTRAPSHRTATPHTQPEPQQQPASADEGSVGLGLSCRPKSAAAAPQCASAAGGRARERSEPRRGRGGGGEGARTHSGHSRLLSPRPLKSAGIGSLQSAHLPRGATRRSYSSLRRASSASHAASVAVRGKPRPCRRRSAALHSVSVAVGGKPRPCRRNRAASSRRASACRLRCSSSWRLRSTSCRLRCSSSCSRARASAARTSAFEPG